MPKSSKDAIEITLQDGKKEVSKGISLKELADKFSGNPKEVLIAKVDGELWDLSRALEKDAVVQLLTYQDKEGRDIFEHSTSHILAFAVCELFPGAKPTIGPAVEEGFYYDFDDLQIAQEDLKKIEKKMQEIVNKNFPAVRKEVSLAEVKQIFKDNPYKVELASDFVKAGEKLTVYSHGDFVDLCRGPHVPSTGFIKAFKLTTIAGAYWRGNAKNKQLVRIYGVSFPNEKLLQEHLKLLEEAEKRDHRKIGKQLKLFMLSDEVGAGLPLWLPRGEIVRGIIEAYMRDVETQHGYQYVYTPHITHNALYFASGHLPYYAENMYPPLKEDNQEYYLKPMNCPHHHMIYRQLVVSYRDLPLRLAEAGTVYRKELSGVTSGLIRVRMITQNDAHIYCTPEQVEQEFVGVLKLFDEVYRVMGIKDYWFRLSLPDFEKNPEKFSGDRKVWDKAADDIRSAMKKFGANFVEAAGEAAFYGPKIDVQTKTVLGREETIATCQVDILVPQRMGLDYTNAEDKKQFPIVIHRAIIGSYERFVGFLIEKFAGRFPLWLSPIQVRVLTIADRFNDFADRVGEQLKAGGVRVEVDKRTESLGKKIREAQLDQVNYILVVGEQEVSNKTVNVRTRDGRVIGPVPAAKFVEKILLEIRERRLNSVL